MPIFCAKANNLKKSKKAKLQNCLNAHYLQNYQKFFVSFSKTAEYNEGVQKKLGRLLKNFCYPFIQKYFVKGVIVGAIKG